MRTGEPSRTALGAAIHRAVHQDLDGARIFPDPLAWQILDVDRADVLARAAEGGHTWLRLFIAIRHRFAEDALAVAAGRGTDQVVVLGAGLDTLAYRNTDDHLRFFEVDLPATGAWKAARLRASGISVPEGTAYVGCDFEREDFLDRLVAEGFDPTRPAFFLWLGVVPYLSLDSVVATLRRIASVPGAEVVFDYPTPMTGLSRSARRMRTKFERRLADLGEPMTTIFDPAELGLLLGTCGFTEIEDLGRAGLLPRYAGLPADAPGGGGHVVRARVGS